MRWAMLAAAIFGFFLSVISADSSEEPRLRIMAGRNFVYDVGEQRAFYCEGTNIKLSDMVWLSPQGKEIGPRTRLNRVYVEKREPNLLVLIIGSTKIEDQGNWTCKMNSSELQDVISIVVGEKAKIDGENESRIEDENKNVKLTCKTKGYPPPTVQWYKENILLPEDKKKYVMSEKNDVYTLEIKKLNHADFGTYMCKVTQKKLSHYTDKMINLTVQHKPVFHNPDTGDIYTQTARVEEIFAVMNDAKNVTCSVIANPPPKFAWYVVRNNFDTLIRDQDLISTDENSLSSTLTLRMKDESDAGSYKCKATNAKGSVVTTFHVTLGEKPMAPDSISFLNANVSYITLNVTCSNCTFENVTEPHPVDPNNLPVIKYSFELVPHKENYSPDWDAAEEIVVDIIDPEITTFDVGPLANSTYYHVRVRSVNAAGFSEWLEMAEIPTTTDHAIRLSSTILLLVAALFVNMGS